jgi:hypothetical protein
MTLKASKHHDLTQSVWISHSDTGSLAGETINISRIGAAVRMQPQPENAAAEFSNGEEGNEVV